MEVIDIHTHIFPDMLAQGAIKYLEDEAGTKAFHDGTAEGLRHSMAEAGIKISVQHPVATKPSQVKSINQWAVNYIEGDIISFGGMHPAYPHWKDEMRKMRETGIKGFKLHPEYQKFDPDDPSLFPFYDCAQENGLIIMFHTGEDIGIKPPYHSTPERMLRLLKTFPFMKMIYAHMGGWMLWDDVERLIIGKEVLLETSFTLDYISDERFVNMVRDHGIEQILFGTDSPWRSQKADLEHFLSLPFTNAEREMMLSGNAKALLRL